jgi:hypothetical protein
MKSSQYSTEFSFFSTVFRAIGLYPHSTNPVFNHFLSGYTIIILIGISTLFTYGLFINSVIGSSGDSLSAMVEALVFAGVIVTNIINVLHAWFSRDEQFQIYEKFDEIDMHFQSQLHHSIDHPAAKKMVYKKYGCLLLFMLVIQGILFSFNNKISIRYWLVLTFCVLSLRFRCFQTLFYIDSMDLKLKLLCDKLNSLIVQNQNDNYFEKMEKHPSFIQVNDYHEYGSKVSVFDQLVIMKQIYGKIWDVANLINDCFGWSLLTLITQNFIEFTCNGYWLFLALDNKLPTEIAFGNLFDQNFICLILMWNLSFNFSKHMLYNTNYIFAVSDCICLPSMCRKCKFKRLNVSNIFV